MSDYQEKVSLKFKQAVDFFKQDISSLRTGRLSSAILEKVEVQAYGTTMALNAVSTIASPDNKSLLVSPWDKSVIKEIEKAITSADLGLGVVNEGEALRLTMPPLNEENRRELVKKLNSKMEEARIVLRQARDEVKQEIEVDFAEKTFSEDDKFRYLKELDTAIDKANEELKEIRDHKEKEIMTI
ncbi:MAG: ribosome-recycling factor [Patescibacteria group bacterium]|nr:MAG: ribosome-recycling factor [Patescibacteria group bacterium]